MQLTDKIVVITGGFGALGRAVANAAGMAGANVVLIDRVAGDGGLMPRPAALALGGIDLGVPTVATDTLNEVALRMGRVDALVNVAGTFRWETVEAGSMDTWDLLYTANLRTAVNASRAALPHLLTNATSRIVNIGAGAAARAAAGMGAYAASKSGVARLTEALSDECRDRGLRVNAVLPSIIDTPANRADMPDADFSRWVRAEQIADLIVFLLSERAEAITGASIPISGRV